MEKDSRPLFPFGTRLMPLIIKLILIVLLPLAWGLGSDWVFARILKRRVRGDMESDIPA